MAKTIKQASKELGRPSSYTQETADTICSLLSDGLSLRSVCNLEDMPVKATVFSWMRKYPEFLAQYTRAKQESADAMAEELLDIADDGTNDWMERYNKEGKAIGWQVNGEAVQRSKLRTDTRKWLMAKMKPKKYGEKLDVDVTSGGKPLQPHQALLGGDSHVLHANDSDREDITTP